MTTESTALDAGGRLVRLLALLAYLSEAGSAHLSDLADRFSMEREDLVSELELAACCGLPPYTPDQLLELVVDDEQVYAFGLETLSRPPRLTPDEGFAVAAAIRTLLAVDGAGEQGPLVRALEKLEAVLGDDRVEVELDAPEHLAPLRHAASRGEVVEIDYEGAGRAERTTREVEPYAVVVREGRFYFDGFCRLAKDWRRFQVARVVAVRPTGEHARPGRPPKELAGPSAFVGRATPVTIALPAKRQALVERIANGEAVIGPDERVRVVVNVADEAFLGRLVLRLGPGAEVLEPAELARAPRAVARAALSRYEKR